MTELLPIPKISSPGKPPETIGLPADLAWLSINDLVIDPDYQRPVGERGAKNIRKIVQEFSWSNFSPLVVSGRPGGRYAVIDGQHRAIAAKSHGGIERVPCMIIAATPEQEAEAFTVINGHVTAITQNQLFHSRVAAKDRRTVALRDCLNIAGVKILRVPVASYRVGETLAVSTVEACAKRYGRNTLITALQTITETGNGNPGLLKAPTISATCAVLHANPQWRDAGEDLFRAIETAGVPGMFRAASIAKAEAGGSLRMHYAIQLADTLRAYKWSQK